MKATNSPQDPPPLTQTALMEATPPSVVRALSFGYPLVSLCNKVLSILTWSSKDKYESVLVVFLYIILVNRFEQLIKYWLPLIISFSMAMLFKIKLDPPTLDLTVHVLESAGSKFAVFIEPVSAINLNSRELVRLVLSSVILSPVYFVLINFVSLKTVVLVLGLFVLCFHSVYFKVFRSLLWRFNFTRQIVFWVTGIDRRSKKNVFKAEFSKINKSQDVSFTFVVLENQRHWLGIGWTPNMLPEERTAFCDLQLNEVNAIEHFELPKASNGMAWQWVDDEWQLDLTNDNQLKESSDGFVYYNNLWKSPSASASFSKYTRSRRWFRKARLTELPELPEQTD